MLLALLAMFIAFYGGVALLALLAAASRPEPLQAPLERTAADARNSSAATYGNNVEGAAPAALDVSTIGKVSRAAS